MTNICLLSLSSSCSSSFQSTLSTSFLSTHGAVRRFNPCVFFSIWCVSMSTILKYWQWKAVQDPANFFYLLSLFFILLLLLFFLLTFVLCQSYATFRCCWFSCTSSCSNLLLKRPFRKKRYWSTILLNTNMS